MAAPPRPAPPGLVVCVRGVVAGQLSVGDVVLFLALMTQLMAPLTYFSSYYRQARALHSSSSTVVHWPSLRHIPSCPSVALAAPPSRTPRPPSRLRPQIQKGLIDMEQMFELLDTAPAVDDAPGAGQLAVAQGDVAFDRVSFGCAWLGLGLGCVMCENEAWGSRNDLPCVQLIAPQSQLSSSSLHNPALLLPPHSYSPDATPVLHNVSFSVAGGRTLALVGATGAFRPLSLSPCMPQLGDVHRNACSASFGHLNLHKQAELHCSPPLQAAASPQYCACCCGERTLRPACC